MFRVKVTLSGVAEATRALEASVNEALRRELQRAAHTVAADAKAKHKFRNRTGKLEASIAAGQTRGKALNGTLSAEVVARMPYASFVEEMVTRRGKWAYLEPAWERNKVGVAAMVRDALRTAIRRTNGWSLR